MANSVAATGRGVGRGTRVERVTIGAVVRGTSFERGARGASRARSKNLRML